MAKKKSQDKNSAEKPQDSTQDEMQSPSSPEQLFSGLQQLLDSQEFASEEELAEYLNALMGSGQPIPAYEPETDLDRAQEIMYQTADAKNKTEAVKMARQALEISPDCADAYSLLADLHAKTSAEAWAFYEAAVKAGERALGQAVFKKHKGHFWGMIETRPYMRARMGLAIKLWQIGYPKEAANHMAAMLELNPNDNQGVREVYINVLLELNDTKRLDKLLKMYPDDWLVSMQYGKALHEFRKNGRTETADELLWEAIAYNHHVPAYLTGEKKLPKKLNSPFYTPGDRNEAIDYAIDGVRVWQATEGAIEWLKEMMAKMKK